MIIKASETQELVELCDNVVDMPEDYASSQPPVARESKGPVGKGMVEPQETFSPAPRCLYLPRQPKRARKLQPLVETGVSPHPPGPAS